MKKLLCILLSFVLLLAVAGCNTNSEIESIQPSKEEKIITKEKLPEKEAKTEAEQPASAPKEPVQTEPAETKPVESVPEATEAPQPEASASTYCTLSVKCNNPELIPEEKKEFIPENGIIYYNEKAVFSDGETVFDVLLREMKDNHIHLEHEYTPAFNSYYVKGISNLYEFDCGDLSGWRYKVNNKIPSYGCSEYKIKDKDIIEWIYYCE